MNDDFRDNLSHEVKDTLRKNRFLPVGNDYVFDTFVTLAGIDYPGKRKAYDLTSPEVQPVENRKVWVWKHQIPYDSLPSYQEVDTTENLND